MKIGYTHCSTAALDGNTRVLREAGCERVLHDSLGQGRVSLVTIRRLLRAGDTLVIRTVSQAADNVQALDALVRDIRAADADLVTIGEDWTLEAIAHGLALLRSFPTPPVGLPASDVSAPTTARRGRKQSRPVPEDDVLRRLGAGDKVGAIARDLGVAWKTIDKVRKRHPSL